MVNMYKLYIPIWFLNYGNWILHVITGGNDILSTLYRCWESFCFVLFLMWDGIKEVEVLGVMPDYRGAF